MRPLLPLALVLMASTLSSCSYLEWLRQQHIDGKELEVDPSLKLLRQAQPEGLLNLVGQTEDRSPDALDQPLLVMAVSSELVVNEVVNAVQTRPPLVSHGPARPVYSLVLPPGDYELLAFADLDQDRFYEGSELVGRSGPGRTVQVDSRRAVDGFSVAGPTLPVDRQRPVSSGLTLRVPVAADHTDVFESLDDEFFATDWGEIGQFYPVTLLNHTQGVLFGLERFDPDKTHVLFIHGARGTPRDFRSLVQGLDRSRYQPWFVFYPSYMPLAKMGALVASVAETLGGRAPARGDERLIVVAHSMGGLVAREALGRLCRGGKPEWLKGFVSFSAAFGGSDSAAEAPVGLPKPAAWRDMASNSAFVAGVHEPELPPSLPVVVFFAWGTTRHHGPDVAGDGVISLKSQLDPRIQFQATHAYGFGQSHVGILEDPQARAQFLTVLEELVAQ